MARLIYSTLSSLDHYVADVNGKWEFAEPDPEVHAFVNALERPVGTYLYGRRTYEVMSVWETLADPAEEMRAYAEIWRAADKVVFSRTLRGVTTSRTRLERAFDPEAIRALKATSERDLGIGGPALAAHAIRAGLVDEWHLLLSPAVVGGGTPSLPDGVRIDLDLLDTRAFANGTVYLRYATRA